MLLFQGGDDVGTMNQASRALVTGAATRARGGRVEPGSVGEHLL